MPTASWFATGAEGGKVCLDLTVIRNGHQKSEEGGDQAEEKEGCRREQVQKEIVNDGKQDQDRGIEICRYAQGKNRAPRAGEQRN